MEVAVDRMKDAIFFNNLMGFFVLKIGEFRDSGI